MLLGYVRPYNLYKPVALFLVTESGVFYPSRFACENVK